jgi:hypothetical protein
VPVRATAITSTTPSTTNIHLASASPTLGMRRRSTSTSAIDSA